jgi:hypothetical protein
MTVCAARASRQVPVAPCRHVAIRRYWQPALQKTMNSQVLNLHEVRDISPEILDADGHPRVVSAKVYRDTTQEERSRLCVEHGLYGLPTTELVDYLRTLIAGRSAIEIGAGNGVLAKALGIRATDSRMQEDPKIAALYDAVRQPVVRYGDQVERLDAVQAIRKYKPQVVVACWVTHKYDAKRHAAGGNQFGVAEEKILAACENYIFVGNVQVHAGKSIWSRPHDLEFPPFVFSRAFNGSPDFVANWRGARAR